MVTVCDTWRVAEWAPIFWKNLSIELNGVTLQDRMLIVCRWQSSTDELRAGVANSVRATHPPVRMCGMGGWARSCVWHAVWVVALGCWRINHSLELLKLHVGGCRDCSNEEVEMAVCECLWRQERYIFHDWIFKLVPWYKKCLTVLGGGGGWKRALKC